MNLSISVSILVPTLCLIQVQTPVLEVPTLSPPTREAAPLTATETAVIRAGIALHNQGKFDEALARYHEVLTANPDNDTALYEIALAHHAKGEFQKAIDFAAKATAYKSPALGQYYSLIGNTLDQNGDPQKAIEIYKKGIDVVPNAATLHYNMAVTLGQKLNDIAGAKAALKNGARAEPGHAGTHLIMAKFFLVDDLRTPALLALSRFLILEPASQRTGEAYGLWYRLLNGNMQQTSPEGGVTIGVNSNQKKDEGDLTQLDLHITLSKVTALKTSEGKSQIASLASQVDMLFSIYSSTKPGDDASTFVWSYYMPYVVEMQQKKFVEPFVYYVSQRTSMPGVREWLTANRERVIAFLAWSKSYPWPKSR